MQVRTRVELSHLDEELDLFREDEWKFLGTTTQGNNFEYFNDIRDTDFDKMWNNRENIKNIIAYITIIMIFVAGICYIKFGIVSKDSEDYLNTLAMQNYTIEDSNKVTYVQGEECNNDDFVAISQCLNTYFNILKNKENLKTLSTCCVDKSVFAKQYSKYMKKMNSNYDIYDCYARALKEMAGNCTLNEIDRVLKKDDTYYCYVKLNMPTTLDIQNYVNKYKINMTKYFMIYEQTDSNFYKFLLETMQQYTVPSSINTYCIEVVEQDGSFLIKDDTELTNLCISNYTNAIAYMSILVEQIEI